MPVVSIPLNLLNRLVGREHPGETLSSLLGELGCDVEGFDPVAGALKVNLLPARPDMFDACGLARCLRGYLGIDTGLAEYRFADSGITVQVAPGLEKIRPFIVAAVARGVRLDEGLLVLLMEMQESLHWGLGRDRRRASIGIYDLNTVQPDFIYRPVEPQGVKFVPLAGIEGRGPVALTPAEILQLHPKGQAYRYLLEHLPAYPLLTDSQGVVLSLPPIINSDDTRVTEKTTDLFIDVTGPDLWAVNKTLAIIATALTDLGAEVARVKITYPDGRTFNTPDMTPEEMTVVLNDVVDLIGISLTREEVAGLLHRMRFGAEVTGDDVVIRVLVPAYRADILHPCDIIEDIAIAYGYHRLPRRLIPTATVSQPLGIEEFSSSCARVLTGMGFIEITSLTLTNPRDQFTSLGIEDNGQSVVLENPVTVEGTILRQHLLEGILKSFARNSTQPLPQKIFEIGDVFRLEPAVENGVAAARHIAIGIADSSAGFADIKAVVDAFFFELDLAVQWSAQDQPFLIPGRSALISTGAGKPLGIAGEVHPEVLTRLEIPFPVVVAEINLQGLVTGGV